MSSKNNKTEKTPAKEPSTKETNLPLQRKLIYQWAAPVRPFKKLDKEVYSTVFAAAFLVGIILFFIDGVMPVIMLIAILFLFYVMGNVKPHQVNHAITNWGIESENSSWPWEVMTRYWIQGKADNRMLVIETMLRWPTHLRFMLGDTKSEKIHTILQQYLVEDRPAPNWLDKSSDWLKAKIRLTPDK